MFGGKLTGGKVTGKGGGGAIALDDQQCIFNMYGGEISGNNGKNYGGAIFRKFNANMPNMVGIDWAEWEFRPIGCHKISDSMQSGSVR